MVDCDALGIIELGVGGESSVARIACAAGTGDDGQRSRRGALEDCVRRGEVHVSIGVDGDALRLGYAGRQGGSGSRGDGSSGDGGDEILRLGGGERGGEDKTPAPAIYSIVNTKHTSLLNMGTHSSRVSALKIDARLFYFGTSGGVGARAGDLGVSHWGNCGKLRARFWDGIATSGSRRCNAARAPGGGCCWLSTAPRSETRHAKWRALRSWRNHWDLPAWLSIVCADAQAKLCCTTFGSRLGTRRLRTGARNRGQPALSTRRSSLTLLYPQFGSRSDRVGSPQFSRDSL